MKYVSLGSTGTLVSQVCLGTANFGGEGTRDYHVLGALKLDDARQLLHAALDAGVNFVDTSNSYAEGESEAMLGELLGHRRDDLVLGSKVENRIGPGPNQVGLGRVHIMRALEDSLRRLRTDYLDLYQVHSIDPLTSFDEVLATLDDAVRQGKVRYVGCSNLAAWEVMKALGVSARRNLEPFVSVQAYYSLVGRDLEDELLPMIRDQHLALTIWSPLAGGLLSGKFRRDASTEPGARRATLDFPPVDLEMAHDVIDALVEIGDAHGVSAARVALAWTLAQPGVTSVIVGARRVEQLADNLGAIDLELSTDELQRLDAVSAVPARYPAWLQAYTNADRLPREDGE